MNEAQVNDMIQRWVSQQKSPYPEDYKQFQRIGSACISQGETAQLLKFIQDDNNKGIVKSMGCTLLSPLLCQILNKEKNYNHCQTAFAYLTETCCSKRAFRSLLELIKDTNPGVISETTVILTPHLQTVVLRLNADQAVCVGQSLSSLHSQLSRLPVPYTSEQEDLYGLGRCLFALTAFIRPFVEKVKLNSSKWVTAKEDEELRVELLKFCMRSLREPLLEAHLCRNSTSPLWMFANDIMMTLCEVQGPLPDILFFNSLRKHISDNDQSVESRACVAYLLFVQQITTDSFPAVFSPVFILQCNMQYIDQMLNRCMLKTSNHSGIEGFIVKNIRNEVEFCLKYGNKNKWFLGPELSLLLELVLCFPHGSETDLLNNMDKIMESLNLLRYLLLRGKELTIHVIWTELCRFRNEYVKMLRVCLTLSRAYYSSQLKSLQEDRKLKVVFFCMFQVLQSAMVTFDLMESLIFRIEEITEERIKI
uniref:Uncharacterized protein n=1 Tax=Periophthalmus magnuspinnatus TaxID=409849 RepID=A0A3B4AF57_9GOBI